jgi:hypothetical protein
MAGAVGAMHVPVADVGSVDWQVRDEELKKVPHWPRLPIEQLAPALAKGWQVAGVADRSQKEVSAAQLKIPDPRQGPLEGRSTQRCDVGSQPIEVIEPPHCALAVQAWPLAAGARQVDDAPASVTVQSSPSAHAKPWRAEPQGCPDCAGTMQVEVPEQNSPGSHAELVPQGWFAAPGGTGVTQVPLLELVLIIESHTAPPVQ